RVGAGNKNSKYTSNKTHYSPTDPDARISVKPGKARKLNYLSQLTVDSANHVITDISAYHACGKEYLNFITKKVKSDHRVSFLILFNTNLFKNKQRLVLSSFYFSF
ncbi:hypothetical protein LVK05_15310, partial [Tenacibaculum maritimum]|nr:hypothetical protein [Tenacibaculum maritimum]